LPLPKLDRSGGLLVTGRGIAGALALERGETIGIFGLPLPKLDGGGGLLVTGFAFPRRYSISMPRLRFSTSSGFILGILGLPLPKLDGGGGRLVTGRAIAGALALERGGTTGILGLPVPKLDGGGGRLVTGLRISNSHYPIKLFFKLVKTI
jgi:hypothetical protein